MPTIQVQLLETYAGPARLVFANGDLLDVGIGEFYACAFGVVIDKAKWRCVASSTAQWKLQSTAS